MPPGCSLYTRKHLLDFGVVKISPVYEHARNFLRVGNILKRIRAEQHHIRNFAFLDRTKLPLHSKEARGIERGSLQRFERRGFQVLRCVIVQGAVSDRWFAPRTQSPNLGRPPLSERPERFTGAPRRLTPPAYIFGEAGLLRCPLRFQSTNSPRSVCLRVSEGGCSFGAGLHARCGAADLFHGDIR